MGKYPLQIVAVPVKGVNPNGWLSLPAYCKFLTLHQLMYTCEPQV